MAFSPDVWNQLKNLTADHLIRALQHDGWEKDPSSKGATLAFIKYEGPSRRRIVIHYHPRKTYGAKLLQSLLADIGWTDNDLRRLKLIK